MHQGLISGQASSGARRFVHYAVGVLLLALLLRTFIATGLVVPIVVQGSSMAPMLWGERVAVTCDRCGGDLLIGIDQSPGSQRILCPCCDGGQLDLTSARKLPADSLWIDRLAVPNRWSPVVLRSPADAGSLFVKRVLGLPGEEVSLREGDLWIDGQRVTKPLAIQRNLRRLEHTETARRLRWSSERDCWRWNDGAWQVETPLDGPLADLIYRCPIHDNTPGNLRLSRRFHPQRDLMLEFECEASPDADWQVRLGGYTARFDSNKAGPRNVLLSVFDGGAYLAIDGQESPQLLGSAPAGEGPPTIRAISGQLAVRNLSLWKDIYYEPHPQAHGFSGDQPWRLGPDEFFVVGDNQALSLDSRNWSAAPGVPRRLILGQPRRFGR